MRAKKILPKACVILWWKYNIAPFNLWILQSEEQSELFYQLALTFVPGIGAKTGRALLSRFGSAAVIFKTPLKELKHAEGVGEESKGV